MKGTRFLAAWRMGAVALFGPLTVLVFVFGTAWSVVAVARLILALAPQGQETAAIGAAVALLVAPWVVKRGWIDRDRS